MVIFIQKLFEHFPKQWNGPELMYKERENWVSSIHLENFHLFEEY